MQFSLEVPGATLNVLVDGPSEAPAVLHFNGASCTARMWEEVVQRTDGAFRHVRFDVRGTGESTPTANPDTEYSLATYSADANAILDHLAIDRAHVWSMAWGSRVGLAYASLHPDRILRCALYDASIGVADVDAQAAGRKIALARQDATGLQRFRAPAGWNDHLVPDAVPLALAAVRSFDLTAAAKSLAMPVLVATGDCDPNLASSRELVALAADARLVVMENVGHGSVLQRPDLATQIFEQFLSA